MNIEAETLDSLRKLVRELHKENTYLKEQLKKANIVFPENNVFEDKIEDTSEYDPDQGARIASRFITEEMANQFFAMFWGRTDVYAKRGKNGGYFPQCDHRWNDIVCPRQRGEKIRCEDCEHTKWTKLTVGKIVDHLAGYKEDGSDVIGVYPLLPDGTCRFLVFDFDKFNCAAPSGKSIKIMLIWSEFYNQFSIQLNEQQQSAVQSVTGPVLLLAVPGSGKTTVLVARLGYMIFCRGIAPEKILTVTYTVAATKDMSERFASWFGQDLADRLEFRTINGICARVIQYYGRKTARTAFSLLTDEKRISTILSAIHQKTEQVYPTEGDLKNVRALITYIKNRVLNEKEIEALDETAEIRISAIYKEYCKHLRENQLMDYDDQMVYAYNMLRKIPWLLEYFQDQYPYICVDEAQDTSKIQHAIIALLASRTENLFMVGDEDQSIYGFRAAYPEALLEFEQHHPGANVLLMEENFRSDAKIVQAADSFIQKNTLRHEKHMRPSRPKQRELREISVANRKAQYSYLLKVAAGCINQTAVLYRDHECALPLIDLLERNGIPYRMRNVDITFLRTGL